MVTAAAPSETVGVPSTAVADGPVRSMTGGSDIKKIPPYRVGLIGAMKKKLLGDFMLRY